MKFCFACRKWYYTTWWKVTTCSQCNIPANAIATSYWVSADTCNWECLSEKWFVKNEAWNGCVCPDWTENIWGKCVSIHWMATCWWSEPQNAEKWVKMYDANLGSKAWTQKNWDWELWACEYRCPTWTKLSWNACIPLTDWKCWTLNNWYSPVSKSSTIWWLYDKSGNKWGSLCIVWDTWVTSSDKYLPFQLKNWEWTWQCKWEWKTAYCWNLQIRDWYCDESIRWKHCVI